jgi:hypothetical protein
MNQMQTRLDALEQQMHTVNRRLRWWRGLACGLVGLAGLAWILPAVIAQEDAADNGQQGLAQRVAALESLLKHVSREGKEIFITGANLHLVNGLGSTDCGEQVGEPIPDCPNGLGNLIVGYNESRAPSTGEDNIRTGSHNVVVGQWHNFSSFGGLVVGAFNTISGDFAIVSGGNNTASGELAVVSGGTGNTASEFEAVVSGGIGNTASGFEAVVSGGSANTASGIAATVSGGGFVGGGTGDVPFIGGGNEASGMLAVVSGGSANTASGGFAVVSGGGGDPETDKAGNTASGHFAVVSGGQGNTASGVRSVVSGGRNRTAEGEFDWVAGSLVEDD